MEQKTAAVNGVNGVDKGSDSNWKVGLFNHCNKRYLTAETFGHEINVSGSNMKKKQIFTLVQDLKDDLVVYIRSHLGCFLSADKYGKVTCDAEEPGETEKFIVEYDKGFSGRWAFRNKAHGNYLGCGQEGHALRCFAKNYCDSELWTVQLSINPQVHLRNVNRKRYAHVCDDQLQVTQTIPWEARSLIFLVFCEGHYLLKTFDGRYLLPSGELSLEMTPDCQFTMEIRSGQNRGLAFRDRNGFYLAGVGSTATMKSRNKTVGKDELFTLEDTHPQVVLVASNGKKVSIKQGVDVTANQDEETEKEIFQMEYVPQTCRWAFRSVDNKYWKEIQGGIQAVSTSICTETLFDVEWQEDGSVALRAPTGGYVYNKRTGSLTTTGSDAVTDKEKFRVKIANRSAMVLKSDHGFVGLKSQESTAVVCNRPLFDIIQVEDVPGQPGVYLFKASNGKYWSVTEDRTVVADGSDKSAFQLQVRDNRHLSIRCLSNNCFMKGEQNGLFKAVGQELDSTVLWEY